MSWSEITPPPPAPPPGSAASHSVLFGMKPRTKRLPAQGRLTIGAALAASLGLEGGVTRFKVERGFGEAAGMLRVTATDAGGFAARRHPKGSVQIMLGNWDGMPPDGRKAEICVHEIVTAEPLVLVVTLPPWAIAAPAVTADTRMTRPFPAKRNVTAGLMGDPKR